MDQMHLELVETADPARVRYWAQLLKLSRDPWPPRWSAPARSAEPTRWAAPTRQPAPARLGDAA